MNETEPPTFPDAVYEEQATYLADHTRLTEKEAEAYLRRQHIPDDRRDNVLQRDLARQMGVSESTYSLHLSRAEDKLDGDDALQHALTTLLLTTDIGGAGGADRQVIGAEKTSNAFVLITETDFFDRDRYNFPSKYKAQFVYRDLQDPAIDFDDLPDDITHYDKHSVFTVVGNGRDYFVKSVAAYVDALDALDEVDMLNTLNLLDDLGFDVAAYKEDALEAFDARRG